MMKSPKNIKIKQHKKAYSRTSKSAPDVCVCVCMWISGVKPRRKSNTMTRNIKNAHVNVRSVKFVVRIYSIERWDDHSLFCLIVSLFDYFIFKRHCVHDKPRARQTKETQQKRIKHIHTYIFMGAPREVGNIGWIIRINMWQSHGWN